MLPEGTLAELIDGSIYMSPTPIRNHQLIVTLLGGRLAEFVLANDLGEVYNAPFDVYLDNEQNAVQPDIVFVAKTNLSIVKGHVHGVPDLVIEVLSPGNRNHDVVKKKSLYERFKVSEYWIIDPETKESIGYELVDREYKEFYRSIGNIHPKLLDHRFTF